MPRAAIIVNPVKLAQHPDVITTACQVSERLGWDEPTWIETLREDPGHSMAAAAAEDGYDVVIAAGGDGTVRGVAGGLLGHDVALGVVPLGTGNLLARNLGLPLDVSDALEVALVGRGREIDVGMVTFDDRRAEPFLVIAGAGLDADTMGGTHDNLKKLIDWGAYVEAGARASLRPGFGATITLGQQDGETRTQHVRSYLVCNCGVLTAGLVLVPQARIDDGLLDVVTLAPYGSVGMIALGYVVATGRAISDRLMSHTATTWSEAVFSRPVQAQIDGDAVGRVRRARTELLPLALTVRVAT